MLLRVDDDHLLAMPRQWTDVSVADPERILSAGRAPFLTADLIGLAGLVARLVEQERRAGDVK